MQIKFPFLFLACILSAMLPRASAQDAPRRLGAIIVCTCDGSKPMTAFRVYEWWGTAVPKYSYQLKEAVNAQIGCGEGKGCMATSLIPDVTAEEAIGAQYKQLNKSIRRRVTSSLTGQRIITGGDGVQVLRIEASGSDRPVATGAGGNGNAGANSDGGVNVSSADMSQFTQNASQGVMILYYGSGGAASNAYVYELRGPALSSKQTVANALTAKIAAADAFIGFEHLTISDCRSAEAYIKKKAGRSIWVHCSGTHNVK